MKIVLVKLDSISVRAHLWSKYTEEQRHKACQFAKAEGLTVYYPETDSALESLKIAIKEHLEIV